jgi:hypothetical protein
MKFFATTLDDKIISSTRCSCKKVGTTGTTKTTKTTGTSGAKEQMSKGAICYISRAKP